MTEESSDASPEDQALPAVAPDIIEQEDGDEIDNVVPTRGYQLLPVVALGGSAGSIGAIQRFFGQMPASSGMAFVVILHLSSEHESSLALVFGRTTSMRVLQVKDTVKIEANTVYIIPPAKHLLACDGYLQLIDLEQETGKRVAVDLFFRSLADSHGPHAIAVVLSGMDGDGAIGIRRIKERGGLTVAQDPGEAEYPSMPESAIATGMVDWILPTAEMPLRIEKYCNRENELQLPSEDEKEFKARRSSDSELALREVLKFLHTRTGHDFSYYKRPTIIRRISRRMQVNDVISLPEYLTVLRTHPGESVALLKDLLISVTNFFRDRDSFEALEKVIPELFAGKESGDPVRVWVPACATGEEVYSIAMLLMEYARGIDAPNIIQIFGCDLDEEAIQTARAGFYPDGITADVGADRLRRWFVKEHGGYRVRRELREIVLFAAHDLLKDAPFSRVDLVSCRNLLIYLGGDAQKRALQIFHFALNQGGKLFLGSSESVEEESPLFAFVDQKHRLFIRKETLRPTMPIPTGPSNLARQIQERATGTGPILPGLGFLTTTAAVSEPRSRLSNGEQGISWNEVHSCIIERFAPPSLIVDSQYDVIHVSEQAGRFLQVGGGQLHSSLFRLALPSLRAELRATLYRAAQSGKAVEAFRVPCEIDGETRSINIRAVPAGEIAPGYLLVIFDQHDAGEDFGERTSREPQPLVETLERQLEQMSVHLRDTIEQYEASAEEHKASNEELQAMNEELRSATEELERSREELQSINKEMTTVNQELKSKVDELSRANSDLDNLMGATAIATVFLDRDLRITRFTEAAVELFHLLPGDVGRPLSNFQSRLDYPNLVADARKVLSKLIAVECQVEADDQRFFLVRLLPYRSADDRIGGVVLTLVDVSEQRRAADNLLISQGLQRESEERLRLALKAAHMGAWDWNLQSGEVLWTPEYTRMFGIDENQRVGNHDSFLRGLHPDDQERINAELHEAIKDRRDFSAEMRAVHPDGSVHWIAGAGRAFYEESGKAVRMIGVVQDITTRKSSEDALAASEERLRLMMENAREYAIFATDLERKVQTWNSGAERLLGYSAEEIVGKPADVIFTEEDRRAEMCKQEAATALAHGKAADERWHVRKDGSRFWGSGAMMAMHNAQGDAIGFVKIFRDQTDERQTQQELEESRSNLLEALKANELARQEIESASQAKDHFLAILSHELRSPLNPVVMAVSILKRRKDLDSEVQDALDMINRNIVIECRLINDLLDMTGIIRGKLEIVRERVDLHEVLNDAAEIVRSEITAKKQTFKISLSAERSMVEGDATRLKQAVWNLLRNASKFTKVEGSIHLTSRNEDNRMVVEVCDNGMGINPEKLQVIFDAFSQANESDSRRFGGLGLGLAITKAIVESHEGQIRAESDGPDCGARLSFTLPLALPTSEPENTIPGD